MVPQPFYGRMKEIGLFGETLRYVIALNINTCLIQIRYQNYVKIIWILNTEQFSTFMSRTKEVCRYQFGIIFLYVLTQRSPFI